MIVYMCCVFFYYYYFNLFFIFFTKGSEKASKRGKEPRKGREGAKERWEKRVISHAQDFGDLLQEASFMVPKKALRPTQDREGIEAVTSSLGSAFSASKHPTLETH